MSPRARAWRNRGLSAGAVLLGLAAFRAADPDAGSRATHLYVAVVVLGYGHLLGGAWFARERLARAAPGWLRGRLGAAFAASALAVLGLLYLEAALFSPLLLAPLLALSVWHAFENDPLLAAVYARGSVPPLPRRRSHHAAAALLSLAAVALFAAAWAGRVPLLPGEVFALWTLYHVVSWLLVSLERGRARGRVLAVHAVPALACAALLLAPLPWEHPLRVAVFAPSLYLFWASLHVAQTLWVRGREPAQR